MIFSLFQKCKNLLILCDIFKKVHYVYIHFYSTFLQALFSKQGTCVDSINYDSFQIQEITKDSESGLMTVHALKNKQEKVALSGFDCIILAIGRGPNTDILGLDGLVCSQLT